MSAPFSIGDDVAIISHDGTVKRLAKVVRISRGELATETDDGQTWVSSTGKPYGDFGRDLDAIRPATAADRLIDGIAARLRDHITLGGDPFGVALADSMYVDRMTKDTEDAKRMVREMCHKAAGEVVRAYLSALDKAGFAVVQAEATDPMAVVAMNAWADLERMKDQRERMRHAVSQGIAASPPPPGADTSERQP